MFHQMLLGTFICVSPVTLLLLYLNVLFVRSVCAVHVAVKDGWFPCLPPDVYPCVLQHLLFKWEWC